MEYTKPRNAAVGSPLRQPYWDGERAAGITGAIPPASAFTEPQMEIVNAIVASGQTPDHNNLFQLYQAIQNLIAASITGGLTTIEVPPGTVSAFAGPIAPTGWFFCQGQAVSRSVYSALFGAIGVWHGAGDGTTTFNLPDYRGEFLRGFDAGRGVDTGRVFGTLQMDEFKSHTHGYDQFEIIGNGERDNNAQAGVSLLPQVTTAAGGTETRPRNRAVNFMIRT
jgi:microcystin-dependent protein